MINTWLQIITIFALFVLAGVISAFRYSLLFVRKSELESRAKEGCKRSELALKLNLDQDKIHLNVEIILIMITIFAVAIGATFLCDDISQLIVKISGNLSANFCHWSALTIIILAIGFIRMLFCETIPRMIAHNAPFDLALKASGPINFIITLFIIPTSILNAVSVLLVKILQRKKRVDSEGATEEKIIDMIEEGAKTGDIDPTEQELIKSIFDFADMTASQCMTPRTDVSAIDYSDSQEDILQQIRDEGYSRFPVYEKDYDHIKGILYARDVINILYDQKSFVIDNLVQPPYFIPDSKKIAELLKDFQARQIHMAIVLDEFGGTAGIITIEDILEEIVGEIQDEYDVEENEFRLITDNSAVVLATLAVDDFNEQFKVELPEDQGDSIGGLIFNELGELPNLRQKIVIDSIEFTILALDGNRIRKVLANKI